MKTPLIFLALFCACLAAVQAQGVINNSNLTQHRLFKIVDLSVPENAQRKETNKDATEKMGFAYFSSSDKQVDITIREMGEVDLTQVKGMMDGLSTSMYNGTILSSEVVSVNGIEFFVTDIKGQWNGKGEVIGMFRYYFNAGGSSYNLLMKYPVDLIDKTKDLKEKMIQSVKLVK